MHPPSATLPPTDHPPWRRPSSGCRSPKEVRHGRPGYRRSPNRPAAARAGPAGGLSRLDPGVLPPVCPGRPRAGTPVTAAPQPASRPTGSTSSVRPGDAPGPPAGELRLAVVMNGGVSLAIWMGGVAHELDLLRRASARDEVPAGTSGPSGRD